MPKKELLAQVMVRTGLVGLAGWAHHRRFRDLKVLAYHRVLPRLSEASFGHDLDLVSAWQEEFDWQMGHLARHYRVIDCRALSGFIASGRWPDQPCAMVTFDDGYLDNHDIAWPILQRHGLPAVVFLATGYIGQPQLFWYDQLVHEVLHTRLDSLTLDDGSHVALGGSVEARRQTAVKLLKQLKLVPNARREQLLSAWHGAMGVATSSDPATLTTPMNWDQVRAMAKGGVEFGSHTVTHPVLTRVERDEDVLAEMVNARLTLEAELGDKVLALAYPTGGAGAYNDRVVDAARRSGHQFAFIYRGGINARGHTDWHTIGRLAVERETTRERFQAMLALTRVLA
jgi:peptidoglycan/xylan/chitin deacetylase (PgdA/CDA1 family)